MNRKLLIVSILALSGCASMAPTQKIARLPVVELGQKAPANGEYILHIAAGKPANFRLIVKGNALERNGEAVTTVVPKQDVWLYKYWASLDGKHWKPTRDLFRTSVGVGIDPKGGQVTVGFDEKGR